MNTNKKIEVFSTPTCHFCHMEKDFLNSHNIEFTNYDVSTDLEKRKYIVELSGQMGVPVTIITDTENPDLAPDILVGFNQSLFEEKLGLI